MQSNVKEIEVEVLPPASGHSQDFARILSFILDDLIPIPGTKHRVGLDPILGLIPGLGDTSTAALSSLILVRASRAGVPRVVLARMTANLLLNALVGAIPGIGDLFSAWFKSNKRNYQLLVRHEAGRRASTTADWIFLTILLVVVAGVVTVITLATAYLAYRMLALLFGTGGS